MDIASLAFRTFSHATESEERVEQALRFVSGTDKIETSRSVGYHGNPIVIKEARITESRKIKSFFDSLDKQEVRKLLDTLENRVDDDSFFFLRLDKQAAFMGVFKMADNEDIIAVRGKIKSYPQSRENAVIVMQRFLGSILE
jgi:RNA-binding protein